MYPWTNYVAPNTTTSYPTSKQPTGQQKNVVNLQHTTRKPATTSTSHMRQHLMSSFVSASDAPLQTATTSSTNTAPVNAAPVNAAPVNAAPVNAAPLQGGTQYQQRYDDAQLTQWSQYYYGGYPQYSGAGSSGAGYGGAGAGYGDASQGYYPQPSTTEGPSKDPATAAHYQGYRQQNRDTNYMGANDRAGNVNVLQSPAHHLSTSAHQRSTSTHQHSTSTHQHSTPAHQRSTSTHQLSTPAHLLSTPPHLLSTPLHQLARPAQHRSTPAQPASFNKNNPLRHPTSLPDVSQPKQLIEGSTLHVLAKAYNPQPTPQKPKTPRTDDKFLVSSIMNPIAPKQSKTRKGHRSRKRKTISVNQDISQENIPSPLSPQSFTHRRVPMSMMMVSPTNTVSSDTHPSRSITLPVQTPTRSHPDDLDGTALSDSENMDISGDEDVATTYITNSVSTSHGSNSKVFSDKFVVEVVPAEEADKLYPPKMGEIYKTGSSLFRCVERPYSGTVFDRILQYIPVHTQNTSQSEEGGGGGEKTKICTGYRYTVWLDKSEPEYICLRKLYRHHATPRNLASYHGFVPGHGILRLNAREAFQDAQCPLSNSTIMNYLQSALPNSAPPDKETSVEGPEPSNILIALIESHSQVARDDCTKDSEVKMLLFPHYIDSEYGEPSFPMALEDTKMKSLFNIFEFYFRKDLKIF